VRPHERRLERELVVRVVVDAVDLDRDVRNEDVRDPEADGGSRVEAAQAAAARILDVLVEAVREDPFERALVVREGRGGLRETGTNARRDALVAAGGPARGESAEDSDGRELRELRGISLA